MRFVQGGIRFHGGCECWGFGGLDKQRDGDDGGEEKNLRPFFEELGNHRWIWGWERAGVTRSI